MFLNFVSCFLLKINDSNYISSAPETFIINLISYTIIKKFLAGFEDSGSVVVLPNLRLVRILWCKTGVVLCHNCLR
jgi:hypothetical protein